ncbi:hypothetical protein PS718_00484 [Pseudomonas fluorescens]|uniref:Uncharacterized protein n=1 Tax=Pseudomonas fluorescens TaxID=294 RepID=A0A5E7A6Y9_PSEFL|nr:hypothetical protein [Pseudomonas fluorescens]VVN71897.1 hypothetical protein PS718_00484 [Pseudomonas fluorescens]
MNIEHAVLPEADLTFKCMSHNKRDDGFITRYNIEVTDTRSEKVATISIEPRHLASARSMKTILLDRCLFYSVTQKKHDQMLLELFDSPDSQAESED